MAVRTPRRMHRAEGCEVHQDCRSSKFQEDHHNPPLSYATAVRKEWRGQRYWLCPNAHHGEVHFGLDERLKNGTLTSRYSPRVRELIEEAYMLSERYGFKPVRTL